MPSTRSPRALLEGAHHPLGWRSVLPASTAGSRDPARRDGPGGQRTASPRAAPAGARPDRSSDELGEVLEQLRLALGADEPLPSSPSLNTSRVGMLMTSYRRAMSGLSSTLSLAICQLALRARWRCLRGRGRSSCTDRTTRPRSRRATGVGADDSSKVASERSGFVGHGAKFLVSVPTVGTALPGAPDVESDRASRRARLELALGFDRGHASGSGRGDRLAVDVVLHVTGREHAVHRGARRVGSVTM